MDRTWLDVPYSQKDQAKALGARWDPQARRWYATASTVEALQLWTALPDIPRLLPGEDRNFGGGLFVDLIPSSCWFTNVRSCVSERDWERIRRVVRARADQRCEACGTGFDHSQQQVPEVHERWEYDPDRLIQALRRLICLCNACHSATHMGLAQIKGLAAEATAHLQRVNVWSPQEAHQHIAEAFKVWRERSASSWELDLTMLTSAGVQIVRPPSAADRREIAAQQLAEQGRPTDEAASTGPENR